MQGAQTAARLVRVIVWSTAVGGLSVAAVFWSAWTTDNGMTCGRGDGHGLACSTTGVAVVLGLVAAAVFVVAFLALVVVALDERLSDD